MHKEWDDNDNNLNESDFNFDLHEDDSYLSDEFVRAFMEADSPIFEENDIEAALPEADIETLDGKFLPNPELLAEETICEPEPFMGEYIPEPEPFTREYIPEPEPFMREYIPEPEPFTREYIPKPEPFTGEYIPEWERTDVSASELQESLYYPNYQVQPIEQPADPEYVPHEVHRRRYGRSVVARKKRRNRRIRFLKTMCLILVCVLLSAASTYLVTEYRINRGDFAPPVTQVVIGGRGPESFAEENPSQPIITMVTPRAAMAPEDLYLMAVDQIVGIRTMLSGGRARSLAETAAAVGSGFIISYDGYILTNFHVIELGYESRLPIYVDLYDGRTYIAQIVGFDRSSDVALIKIAAENLSAAAIGNSDIIRVGQTVYAIGNPFGELVYTMTDGIVSALDRVVTIERQVINTFQFSAAVNTGNSGGPIFNIYGEVIGIVTAKVARQGVEGIGFAIPINDAIDIATKLIEVGFLPGRALIGITIQTITSWYAEEHDLVVGSRVDSVNPNSAAENAGILEGDIIIDLGDLEVTCNESLAAALRTFSAGDTTIITVWRDGEVLELTITFDENPRAGLPQR